MVPPTGICQAPSDMVWCTCPVRSAMERNPGIPVCFLQYGDMAIRLIFRRWRYLGTEVEPRTSYRFLGQYGVICTDRSVKTPSTAMEGCPKLDKVQSVEDVCVKDQVKAKLGQECVKDGQSFSQEFSARLLGTRCGLHVSASVTSTINEDKVIQYETSSDSRPPNAILLRQAHGISVSHCEVLKGNSVMPLGARSILTEVHSLSSASGCPKLDKEGPMKDMICEKGSAKAKQAMKSLKVYYSGMRCFSSGRGSEEEDPKVPMHYLDRPLLPDLDRPLLPEAEHDSALLSPKLIRPHSIERTGILHSDARLLLPNVTIIRDRCIDEGSFHMNFDPVEYCKCYRIIEELPIPGEQTEKLFTRVTDFGLILFRSLAKFIGVLHASGNCLSSSTPLTLGNLAITSEGKFRVRFDLVKFVPLGSSNDRILVDYKNVETVLKDLLVQCYGRKILKNLPADIKWWFHIMDRWGPIQDPYIIHNHASLLPLQNISHVFMKIYTVLLVDKVQEQLIIREIPDSFCLKEWYVIGFQNRLFKPWMDKYPGFWTTKFQLLRLHRNIFSHKELTPEGVDLDFLLYALYPDLLCIAQQRLWFRGNDLSIENDFGDKKRS